MGYAERRLLMESADGAARELRAIVSKSYPQFVAALRARLGDGNVMAALQAGRLDGRPEDEVVELPTSPVVLRADRLRPTQSEVDVDSSLMWQLRSPRGGTRVQELVLTGGPVEINGPILTLNGQWVIDGHHRWSQVYCLNPECGIVAMDMRTRENVDPVSFLKAVQLAIAAVTRAMPQMQVRGSNLFRMGKRDLIDYVVSGRGTMSGFDGVSPAVAALLSDDGSPESAADRVWSNVERMQRGNRPAHGAPERSVMPQADAAMSHPGFSAALGAGDVNYKEPFVGR